MAAPSGRLPPRRPRFAARLHPGRPPAALPVTLPLFRVAGILSPPSARPRAPRKPCPAARRAGRVAEGRVRPSPRPSLAARSGVEKPLGHHEVSESAACN